ncbi:alanyl-tRNA editing protein [Afifella sp. H1R]|uniref:alanyl-tRNA editing protein n=1 Tax=Afifella sp. H1R TaxID=2908841 RepID=UPI001F252250|nr:alanyl-tRNA editing protein [Afifella sp. H1R]
MSGPTELLFRDDAYLKECEAEVVAINDRGGVILDKTVFYATGGGQPGDTGRLLFADGEVAIGTTVYGEDKSEIVHVPAGETKLPLVGERVKLLLDWDRRHAHMRMHTALHLLCSLIAFPVTGGSIGASESRLDFDIAEADAIDKDALTDALNELVKADHAVTTRWITDEELADNPDLVRTMSVKPPTGSGKVRLVAIGADGSVDLQPCGGTHVRSTGEIGALKIGKIEKKGRQNRRIRLQLAS